MQELLKALVKAKAEFKPIPKDKQGPRNRYSSLDAVLGAVEPAIHKNGLAIVQATKHDGERFYLETTLFHTSGESLTSTYPLLDGADSQKIGSSITYARRYSLCALLSVVADEDDDGAAASPSAGLSSVPSSRKASKPAKPSPHPEIVSEVRDLITDAMADGLDVDRIRKICRDNNLPDASVNYKTKDQATKLAQLLQDEIAKLPTTEAA